MATPAGWRPDPTGKSRLQWFDGQQWTPQYAPMPIAPSSQPKMGGGWKVAFGIAAASVVVAFGVGLIGVITGDEHGGASPDDVIETCQGSVKKQLRDPDSARFSDWEVWDSHGVAPGGLTYNAAAGDKLYSASGMADAKNGFGGYGGSEAYTCNAVVTADGDITAQAINISDLLP